MPRSAKVVVAARPPVSKTGTLAKSLGQVVSDLRLVAVELVVRPGAGGEIGVAAVARGLRVREDDLDALGGEVAPVLDVLRVAGADHEGRQRVEGRGVVRQLRLPVGGDEAVVGEGLDVDHLVEGDDVGLEALHHRARLLRRAGVALVDLQRPAVLGLEVGGELLVDRGVELAADVVGDVEDAVDLGVRGRSEGERADREGDRREHQVAHVSSPRVSSAAAGSTRT